MMNSDKSMDDILDSIRRIVHEEETGEKPPATRAASGAGGNSKPTSDSDVLVLTAAMRVEPEETLKLDSARRVSEDEVAAISALRLDRGAKQAAPEAKPAREIDPEAVASLRLDHKRSAEAEDETVGDMAALAEAGDGFEDDDAAAEDAEAAETAETDEYGFNLTPDRKRFEHEMAKDNDPLPFKLRFGPRSEPAEAPAEEMADEAVAAGDDAEEEAGNAFTEAADSLNLDAIRAAFDADRQHDADAEPEEDAPAAAVSREEIGEMVREAVRRELSGDLAERIAEDVREIVRREIARAVDGGRPS